MLLDIAKNSAADFAIRMVRKDMIIGLGTGSTANIFVKKLAEVNKSESLGITGVPTSNATRLLAKQLGITIANLDDVGKVDIVFDGTDEFDPFFNLIKGGGGALLQEKIVAKSAKQMVVLADETKKVEILGKFPLPVEIVRFGASHTISLIKEYLQDNYKRIPPVSLRKKNDSMYISDEGHLIIDISFDRISDPMKTSVKLNSIVGVVETGLFVNIAKLIIVGKKNGEVEILK